MNTPTTELEAVNTMLRAIGEAPTSSLTGEVGVDVVTAKATLDEVSREVQSEGWLFNTEHDYPMARANNGEIYVPASAAVVDVSKRRYPGIEPVMRGNRLYDRKNHTYSFDQDVEARVVFLLPFTNMPETARRYVTIRAARMLQDDSLGSNDLHRFKERDEMFARIRFVDEQSEDEDLNFLRETPDFNQLWSV